ncbi:MAG: hypothetical protein DI598_00770 [Pseudopedobacter saltans]|uniref:Methyltransferase FkbM domain-containing protein n=1 Tax=Pseudopedobacter saltans TaxID=151895 RepID=A0A2W5H2X4_9SPHI|nr:MAG: hypothetical protein DI598_00770 [Pseudopedobacter saltans]
MNGTRSFISKFFFCLKVSSSAKVLLSLIRNTKIYSRTYKNHTYNASLEGYIYPLKMSHQIVHFYIRTFTGDFDVFYEIFWRKVYSLPNNFGLNMCETIVDLGANVGFFSMFYGLKYPKAKFICVEPEKNNVNCLSKNLAFLPQVHIEATGISSKKISVNVTKAAYAYNFAIQEVATTNDSIQTITMSELFKKYQLSSIDLLKIDIEGEEADLLSNDNKWLDNVRSIIVELHGDFTIDRLTDLLRPFGFKVYYMDGSIYYATKL